MGLFIFGLAVYAISDVIASTDQRRNNTPKFMWIIITLLIPILGPIIWIVFSNANKQGPPAPRKGTGRFPNRPSGPTAPDDDLEFLWKLQAERRLEENREFRRKNADDSAKDQKPSSDDGQSDGKPADGS